jgi:hypothetical protein
MNERSVPDLLPTLGIRIGVTGAVELSPGALAHVRGRIEEVLALVRDEMLRLASLPEVRAAYRPQEPGKPFPRLRVVSPLAQGADRLVAERALDMNYEMQCAFPFDQAEYEHDFSGTPGSTAQFRTLAARAITLPLEMDGGRGDDESRSYEAVGRLVVRNCDVLIAIWNGRPGKGRGGTADTVRFATNFGPPVWWIHAEEDKAPVWLTDPHQLGKSTAEPADAASALRQYLTRLVVPPALPDLHPHTWFDRLAYVGRRSPTPPYLMRMTPAGPKRRIWRASSWLMTKAAGGAPSPWTPPRAPDNDAACYWFEQYAPADARAGEYAARYRSSYILVFAFAALAVLFGTLTLAVSHEHTYLKLAGTILELATLVPIAVIVWANLRRAWHPLSIEYRLLAELCRKQQALAPLGWSLPGPTVRAKLTPEPSDGMEDDLQADRAAWVEWLFGALQRSTTLPTGSFSAGMIADTLAAALDDLVRDQLKYHRDRRIQSRTAGNTFERIGEILFFAVLAVVLLKLGLKLVPATRELHEVLDLLGVLAAALPAFSAAFVGIRAYAELSLLADQSRYMQLAMAAAERRLSRMTGGHPLASQELGAEIFGVAALMLQDVQGWVQLFRAKVVEPG